MKKILLTLTISASCCIYSMKQERHETEEQFIARSKKEHPKLSLQAYVHIFDHFPKGSFNISRVAYCPDESKIIAVRFNEKKHPDFIIFDVKDGARKAREICRGSLRRHCDAMTLSQSGDTIAFIYKKLCQNNNYKYFLALQKVNRLKIVKLHTPIDISNAHIAFNKQDTHLMVYNEVNSEFASGQERLLLPLKED